ncbi:MAG: cation:dicarboxylate symporter family transporter, partial [Verrucomicrobiales bacterium]
MKPLQQKRWYQVLYIQVLLAALAGVAVGFFWPDFGKSLRPLGDGFIKLVKMIIAPIIFCTVAHGVAAMHDVKKLGRIGGKTLLYFEVVSSLALVIGLVVVNVLKPGEGFNIDPATLDPTISKNYTERVHTLTFTAFILNIIPGSFFDALARGDILQVVLVAILTGFAVSSLGEHRAPILRGIEYGSKVFFAIMGIIVKAAPVGAFGAMAFTIGSYGLAALKPLAALMFGFYLTAFLFVVIVLGFIARAAGFSIFKFIKYIREELLLVLGTSSSETALPGMLAKMERLGCAESTVGLVLPT